MKVVHLSTSISDSSACTRLHEALLNNGVESVIVTLSSNAKSDGIVELGKGSIKTRTLKLLDNIITKKCRKHENYPFNTGFTGYDIDSLEIIRSADIIHLHWICGFITTNQITKIARLGKPIVWTFHDIWPMTGGCHVLYDSCDGYKNNCDNCPFIKQGCNVSKAVLSLKKKMVNNTRINVIVPSNWMKQMVLGNSIFMDNKCEIIPNTGDLSVFRKYARADICKILGTDRFVQEDNDRINVLFGATSADIPYKGFTYLERILERIKTEAPEISKKITLHIVGGFSGNSSVVDTYDCQFWGYIQDPVKMAAIYSLCDFLAYPSLADSFSYVVMEALACETPALVFATGGITDMVEHKVNGYIASYKNEEELYCGFRWMIENSYRENMGEKGREKIKLMCDSYVIADKHICFYKELIY